MPIPEIPVPITTIVQDALNIGETWKQLWSHERGIADINTKIDQLRDSYSSSSEQDRAKIQMTVHHMYKMQWQSQIDQGQLMSCVHLLCRHSTKLREGITAFLANREGPNDDASNPTELNDDRDSTTGFDSDKLHGDIGDSFVYGEEPNKDGANQSAAKRGLDGTDDGPKKKHRRQ